MRTLFVLVAISAFFVGAPALRAQEEEKDEATKETTAVEPPEKKPGQPTESAPLVIASDKGKALVFQIGVDAFGGLALGGAEFIGGFNAALVYPIIDWVWVGIRPSLHYVYDEDSDYEITWFHPEVVVNVNFLHDPVRLYFLAAGGYSGALDTDQYTSIAHGWGVLAGVGVAWQGPCGAGLFAELGFRVGGASRDQTMLVRNPDNNEPICADADCLVWETEVVSRDYSLTAFTINIGVIYSP
jgi:hypothetical protein